MAANKCQQNYKMSDKEIKVPNIGEFKDVEVIEVLVSSGQSVSKNDPLITIESDKSSVEIPASFDGKVKSVKIKVGDRVSEGDLILTVEQFGEEEKKIEQKNIKELGALIKSKSDYHCQSNQITFADLTGVAVQDIQIAKAVFNECKRLKT